MNVTRLAAATTASALAKRLREAIDAGQWRPGELLRQEQIAAEYGVSRIPVREALFQLEAEGFVRIVPHKGAIVSELSFDEVNDVFDLRALLEPRMLASSAPRFDADDFAGLDAIQARFEAAIAAGDVAQWGAINAEFHLALYAKANQPRTQSIVVALLQTSDRYTRVQLSNTEAMGVAELEHAELIRLCRAGAFVEAGRFLVHHIEAVRRDLLRVLARTT